MSNVIRLVHDAGKTARAVADDLRGEVENVVAETGEELVGYAVVGWTRDGMMRSALRLEAGSPLTLVNAPARIKEHLARRAHEAE